ncbi:hypothetical protein N656DRAFT_70891 [Canariomyces notabilis]|uniref:Uncharacterized protein n=1 Tax=Canariomyces notabilis TaxID=2074819 RepID=A0AAN6TE20_9PEZI|nr:hypothetical protein N656DRAFT_70891 [Canariomyces arenarius]
MTETAVAMLLSFIVQIRGSGRVQSKRRSSVASISPRERVPGCEAKGEDMRYSQSTRQTTQLLNANILPPSSSNKAALSAALLATEGQNAMENTMGKERTMSRHGREWARDRKQQRLRRPCDGNREIGEP